MLVLSVGSRRFLAVLEAERAPATCAALRGILPLRGQLVQARWSGEALWLPLGDRRLGLAAENATSRPAPGQILLYPGDRSEMEILIPYGQTVFASKFGQQAGNHVATIVDAETSLRHLGEEIWWHGAIEVVIVEDRSLRLPRRDADLDERQIDWPCESPMRAEDAGDEVATWDNRPARTTRFVVTEGRRTLARGRASYLRA